MTRQPVEIAVEHIQAVVNGDPIAMAANYAPDATLIRPQATFTGLVEIKAYFTTVPQRLGKGQVIFEEIRMSGPNIKLKWRIEDGPADGVSGVDEMEILGEQSVSQRVSIDSSDF